PEAAANTVTFVGFLHDDLVVKFWRCEAKSEFMLVCYEVAMHRLFLKHFPELTTKIHRVTSWRPSSTVWCVGMVMDKISTRGGLIKPEHIQQLKKLFVML